MKEITVNIIIKNLEQNTRPKNWEEGE